jgi:GAF domain-containing protein
MSRRKQESEEVEPKRPVVAGDVLAQVTTRALALEEVALALASSEDVDEMAAALLPVVAGAVGAREAALILAESEGQYRLTAQHGAPEDLREGLEESPVEQAAASVAASSEEWLAREGISEDDAFQEWREEQELDERSGRPYYEIYGALRAHETVVGVLALGRRADGADFSEDDLAFLEHVASGAAVAVRRCILERENRRKIEMLRALARFTSEITSTLDLNRVLLTVANTTEAVIERDRALVALLEGGALRVRAVSDKVTVEINEAEVLGMADVLREIQNRRGRLRVTQEGVGDETTEMEGREAFAAYFEASDMQSLLALPLQDEESLLGYLILESRNPEGFGDPTAEEFLGILSGAVTVAIRNADLYRRVPMVGLLAPIADQRRRLEAMTPAKRRFLLGGIAVAALFVGAVPLPRHAAGPASVRPSEVLAVTALSPGIVDRVHARGGETLVAGAPVATIRNRETEAQLAAAEAELGIAQRRAAQATEQHDAAEAQRWALAVRNLEAWMRYARSEEQDQRLVAPASGAILTPRIEERVGEHMERGDVLCEVGRLDPAYVEVQIPEEDVGALHPGRGARVKVLAYPDRQFRGKVISIAPEGVGVAGKPATFTVTVECANPNLDLLAGMTGRAKIDAGLSPWLWNVVRPIARVIRMNFWI